MAEYNMPQYILREFKVTDARVSAEEGSLGDPGTWAGPCGMEPRDLERASLVGSRSKGPGVGISTGCWEEAEWVVEWTDPSGTKRVGKSSASRC